ncbi:hypothetical protein ScPMuIL_001110 [Solemya velum]
METLIVQNVLRRCRVSDIPKLLNEWNCSEVQIDKSQTKGEIIRDIIELYSDDLTATKAGDLQLIYATKFPEKRKWSCFHLSGGQDSEHKLDPWKLMKDLKKQLPLHFGRLKSETYVSGRIVDGALWMWAYVKQSDKFQSSSTIMFVYYPRTPYIFINHFRAKLQEPFMECLVYTFGYSKLTNMQLTGTHLESLLQLALNKDSQGSFSRFRLKKVQAAPLSTKMPLKRKEPDYEPNPSIICENSRNKRRKLEILDNTFGTEAQPVLEEVEYKLEVRFRGSEHVPAMVNRAQPFRCKFKFEGPAVLDGIKNLGKSGLATVPLPSILTSVSSKARNHFVLQDSSLADKSATRLSQQ